MCRLYSGSLRPLLSSSFPHLPTSQPYTLLHRQEEREGACPGAQGTFISLEPPQTLGPGDVGTERVCQGDGHQHIPQPALCLPSRLATLPAITLEQISKRPLSLPDTAIFWKSAAVDIPTCCYNGNGWSYSCEVHHPHKPPWRAFLQDTRSLLPPRSAAPRAQGRPQGKVGRVQTSLRSCNPAAQPLGGKWRWGAEIWSQPLPSPQKGWGAMGHELPWQAAHTAPPGSRERSLLCRGLGSRSSLPGTRSEAFLSGLRVTIFKGRGPFL